MNVVAVVLAAGGAAGFDALRPVDGGAALAVVLRTLAAARVAVLVVVPPTEDETIAEVVRLHKARAVRAAAGRAPMLSSVRVGLDALPESASGMLLWPVNRPLVAIRTVRALVAAHEAGAPIALPVCAVPGPDEGRRGHPVLFHRDLFDALRAAPDDQGAASVVRADPGRVIEVAVQDRGILADITIPETTSRLEEIHERARQAREAAAAVRRKPLSRPAGRAPGRRR